MRSVLRIGLTGGIASGKTHVLSRLAAAGLHTVDLDAVGHDVIARGRPAYHEIVAAFGAGVVAANGDIDRRLLGALVFAEAAERERLNRIVHPRILEEEARRVSALGAEGARTVITDGSLLVEAGYHVRYARLVVVHCAPELQLQRLMARDGLDASAAGARIAAQMPVEQKRSFAHYEVDTSSGFDRTDAVVALLADEIQDVAQRLPAPVTLPLERAVGCLVGGPQAGPGGLSPATLVHELVRPNGLALQALRDRLTPPRPGPWYAGGPDSGGGPGPESLAGPLVIASLARLGVDPPYLDRAAASLARVTHSDPARIAGAARFARFLQEAAVTRAVPPLLENIIREDHGLRGAVLGLIHGIPLSMAPPSLVQAVESLLRG